VAHVVIAGPVSWNTIVRVPSLPTRPETVFASGHEDALGGTSAGKALNLARLGVDVTLRTVLGNDDAAPHIEAALAHPRLTLEAATREGPSEHHLNLMTPEGGRLSIYLDLPPDPGPPPPSVVEAVARADVVVADLADHTRALIPLARQAGVPLWCDLHDYDGVARFHREFAEAADVLAISGERMPDVRAFLTARVDAGAVWAVCTLGARGAVAFGREEGWVEVPAVPVIEVVDTNGAGDAFFAGMLLGRIEGRPLADCMRLGTAAGALAVSAPGLVSEHIDAPTVHRMAELSPTPG
jgi:sugar/nucleoside kinase (ribokinase family)